MIYVIIKTYSGAKLYLNYGKGKLVNEQNLCKACGKESNPVYRCSSNLGRVCLCEPCMQKAKPYQSYGAEKENLIDGKFIRSGGSWESNKKKH